MGLHGMIIYAGQHSYIPVIYGIKIYINVLFELHRREPSVLARTQDSENCWLSCGWCRSSP